MLKQAKSSQKSGFPVFPYSVQDGEACVQMYELGLFFTWMMSKFATGRNYILRKKKNACEIMLFIALFRVSENEAFLVSGWMENR